MRVNSKCAHQARPPLKPPDPFLLGVLNLLNRDCQ